MSRRAAAERAEMLGIGLLSKGCRVFIRNGKLYVPQGTNPRTKKACKPLKLYCLAVINKTKNSSRMYTVSYDKPTEYKVQSENQIEVSSANMTLYEKFCKVLWNMNNDICRANIIYMGLSINDFPKPLSKAEVKKTNKKKSMDAYAKFVSKNLIADY